MTSIRKFRGERCYAKISNKLLQNSKLSFKARGLMAYILSLPDNWELCSEHLYTCSDEDGKVAVQSAIRELIAFRYLGVEYVREAKTARIISKGYIAFDDPSENTLPCPKKVSDESHKIGNLSDRGSTTTKEIGTKEIEIKETLFAEASPSAEKVAVEKKPRKPNELLEALAAIDRANPDEVTNSGWSNYARVLREIKAVTPNVTAQEIELRAKTYKQKHPTWELTANALPRHWPTLGSVSVEPVRVRIGL